VRLACCIDLRKLNALIVKNEFPIPLIDDLLDELCARYICKMDLRSGYNQARMHEEDIYKKTFRTHNDLYEWWFYCNFPELNE